MQRMEATLLAAEDTFHDFGPNRAYESWMLANSLKNMPLDGMREHYDWNAICSKVVVEQSLLGNLAPFLRVTSLHSGHSGHRRIPGQRMRRE